MWTGRPSPGLTVPWPPRAGRAKCMQSPQVPRCFSDGRSQGKGEGRVHVYPDKSLSSRTIHIRIWGAGYLAPGMSLVVQWLKISTPNAGGPCLTPGQGTSSHMPQLKIPHNAMKTRHSWINKLIFFFKYQLPGPTLDMMDWYLWRWGPGTYILKGTPSSLLLPAPCTPAKVKNIGTHVSAS